jgi:hypothetical protein
MSGRWRSARRRLAPTTRPGPAIRGDLDVVLQALKDAPPEGLPWGPSRDIPALWQCKRFIPCAVRRAGYAPEQGGEQPIDQGAIDQPINLIEPVAQDRGPGRDGQEHDRDRKQKVAHWRG